MYKVALAGVKSYKVLIINKNEFRNFIQIKYQIQIKNPALKRGFLKIHRNSN